MILYPAVDIQSGKAVRLKQGKKDHATVFSDNPLDMAKNWHDQGAEWLHIVDLDGAFEGTSTNVKLIKQICDQVNVKIQIGGGIRSIDMAETYMEAGADRIIIGTMAFEEPRAFNSLCRMYPGRIGISLDAENGQIKTHGWEKDADCAVEEILPALDDKGVSFVIYTDIARDGMRAGVNLAALERVLKATRLPVICAGGVASIEDIKNLHKNFAETSLAGVISGRALYEGALNFVEANSWLKKMESETE